MNDRLLGMYVHMHWAYKHPYAARTWSLEDWHAYLTGLHRLGYNLLQIWPMIDTMPVPMTPSDRAHLEKLGAVIDLAHNFGMQVYVGGSANTRGTAQAADYSFEERPYFTVERRINPADKEDVAALMAARRHFMEPLAQANGFWIIDSDPGGYPGSSPQAFAQLFQEHRSMLDSLRPGITLQYWMWQGWTDDFVDSPDWSENPQPCWAAALETMCRLDPAPWGIQACSKGHFSVIESLQLTDKTLYFPYGAIESEPAFPFTLWDPQRVQDAQSKIPQALYSAGILANAQSHCLQVPHTYLFQHLANGGRMATIDLEGFAEEILPGQGDKLAAAWRALGGTDTQALLTRCTALSEIPTDQLTAKGRYAGLCFDHGERLVRDLVSQGRLKAAILMLQEEGAEGSRLETMIVLLERWAACHGFRDRYLGTFRELLHPRLEAVFTKAAQAATLQEALSAFETGNPHGAFERLLGRLRHDLLAREL